MMDQIIPGLMILMGVGMNIIWTVDILSGDKLDRSSGLIKSRNKESGDLMLPHWIAEYGTAAGLIAGGVGLLISADWSNHVSLISLGALAYTSINSISWSLAEKERFGYALPMIFGILVSVFAIIHLLTRKI